MPATKPTAGQILQWDSDTQSTWVDKPDITTKVSKSGDTMTGALILNADPTNVLGAATKQYVDNNSAESDHTASFNSGAGGTTWTLGTTMGGAGEFSRTKSVIIKGYVPSNAGDLYINIYTNISGFIIGNYWTDFYNAGTRTFANTNTWIVTGKHSLL